MKILLFVLALAGIGLLVYMNVVDRTQVRHPAAPTTAPADESAAAAPTAEAAPADSSAEAASGIRPWRIDRSQVVAVHGAEVAFEADDVIRLRMPSAEWDCGLRIVPPSGASAMDLSGAFSLAMDVENCSTDRQMRLTLHLSSGGRNSDSDDHATAILAKNRSANIGIGLNPGERATMRIPLMHPEIYLAPEGALGPHVLDTARINTIEIKAQWPFEDEFRWVADCRIANIRLEGVPDASRKVAADRYRPFIDPYGQFVHDDWPEKVKDDAALQADLAEERAALLPRPEAWDEYGGWKDGPQLAATGNFRTEKVDGKWHLVTPSGHLFFSTGIDVIRNVTDASDGGKNPDWYVQDVQPGMRMAFSDWNIAKKFGKQDYLSEYYAFVQDRLASWGMNTIGNWSARELMLESRTPYVATVFERDPTIPTIPRLKHYDCFDETFATTLHAAVRRRFADDPALAKSRTDPRCIGYFIDNELDFNGVVNWALAADFETCAAKRALLSYAEKQYGTIAKLNAAWETSFATFEELKTLQKPPKAQGFRSDATAFATAWYERYFRACRDALAEAAPGKLYLGPRFVGFRQSQHLWNTAAKYCDVVTVNTYANSIFNISQNIYRDSPVEKPILVGEFHFGTFDRGMFKAGLCPVADQAERARSYTRFVQGALCHPLIVGCHWFQYRDQPLIGRGDGEAYQIGFVDTCDRVYPELVQAARDVGENLYAYRERGRLQNAMD